MRLRAVLVVVSARVGPIGVPVPRLAPECKLAQQERFVLLIVCFRVRETAMGARAAPVVGEELLERDLAIGVMIELVEEGRYFVLLPTAREKSTEQLICNGWVGGRWFVCWFVFSCPIPAAPTS